MTFSVCVFLYYKDTCDANEYIATVYNVLHKLEGIMTTFKFKAHCR